jgi:hypothetical protein
VFALFGISPHLTRIAWSTVAFLLAAGGLLVLSGGGPVFDRARSIGTRLSWACLTIAGIPVVLLLEGVGSTAALEVMLFAVILAGVYTGGVRQRRVPPK